jgi:hypothetical protein
MEKLPGERSEDLGITDAKKKKCKAVVLHHTFNMHNK